MESTSSHNSIKDALWNNLHRDLMNTSRGPWAPETTRKIPTQPGRTKGRQIDTSKWDKVLYLWRGAEGKERFPQLGKPSHQWGDQLGQKRSFGGSEERAATRLRQAGQHKTYLGGKCQSPLASA